MSALARIARPRPQTCAEVVALIHSAQREARRELARLEQERDHEADEHNPDRDLMQRYDSAAALLRSALDYLDEALDCANEAAEEAP